MKEITRLSIQGFTERNVDLARRLREMDNVVDKIYLDSLRNAAQTSKTDIKCIVFSTLIIRYLERITDHATYIGDSVLHMVSGERSARK